MTTDDLRTRAREAAEEEYPSMHDEEVSFVRGGEPILREGFIAGALWHAAQQPTRDEPIGWDDRKELADVFQDAGARFPVEGLSDDLYSGLLAVARWGAEQPRYPHAGQQPSREEVRDELAHWPIAHGYESASVSIDDAGDMADAVLALFENGAGS